jgi:hypothetical protein
VDLLGAHLVDVRGIRLDALLVLATGCLLGGCLARLRVSWPFWMLFWSVKSGWIEFVWWHDSYSFREGERLVVQVWRRWSPTYASTSTRPLNFEWQKTGSAR